MKIIIVTNDQIAYSGVLLYQLVKNFHSNIAAIFIQDGILNSETGSLELITNIAKKSGWMYVFFLILESVSYKCAIYFRRLLHLNDYEHDHVIETPSYLGRQFKIPVYKLNGTINNEINLTKIRNLLPDIIIAIRYAEILKEPLLSIPEKGVINFHPSLLPSYGGIAPIFQALYRNEKEIGYSLHFIDKQIDTGKIITQDTIKLTAEDSVSALSLRAHIKGSYSLLDLMKKIISNQSIDEILTKNKKTYFSWPDNDDVKKFLRSGKKLIHIKDFTTLLFYNKDKILN